MHPTRALTTGALTSPLLKNLHWAALAWIACFELVWALTWGVAWAVAWGFEQLAAIIRPLA
jgi:hypothetical protein